MPDTKRDFSRRRPGLRRLLGDPPPKMIPDESTLGDRNLVVSGVMCFLQDLSFLLMRPLHLPPQNRRGRPDR